MNEIFKVIIISISKNIEGIFMKKFLILILLFGVISLYSSCLKDCYKKPSYQEELKVSIAEGNIERIYELINNHGPFDRKIFDEGLLLAAKQKNKSLFNSLEIYASRKIHIKAVKIMNETENY